MSCVSLVVDWKPEDTLSGGITLTNGRAVLLQVLRTHPSDMTVTGVCIERRS
jgi:hypothetical protein